MLTWKQIKDTVENGSAFHRIKDDDLLTFVTVCGRTVGFGVVGQDGFITEISPGPKAVSSQTRQPVNTGNLHPVG